MSKPNSLLSRRKALQLFEHPSITFKFDSLEIISPLEAYEALHVQIPTKQYTGMGLLLKRLHYKLWQDVVPQNTLNRSFFISLDSLTCLRQVTMSVYATCLTWQITRCLTHTPTEDFLVAHWLSFWGLLLCTTYFFLIFLCQDQSDNKLLWKFVYIIGEVGIAIELLILAVYPISLISSFLIQEHPNIDDTAFKFCTVILCPILAMVETYYNYIEFPEGHRFYLSLVTAGYLCCDLWWTLMQKQSATEMIDWVTSNDGKRYLLKGAFVGALLVEFVLGNKFFHWKLLRCEKRKTR